MSSYCSGWCPALLSYRLPTLLRRYLHTRNTSFPSHSAGSRSSRPRTLHSYCRSTSHTPEEITKVMLKTISEHPQASVQACSWQNKKHIHVFSHLSIDRSIFWHTPLFVGGAQCRYRIHRVCLVSTLRYRWRHSFSKPESPFLINEKCSMELFQLKKKSLISLCKIL